jgi:hypothetical protein
VSQEPQVTPQQPKVECPNGQGLASSANKKQLSPTVTVIILVVIAVVIFILPTNKSTKTKASPPAITAVTAPVTPVVPAPIAASKDMKLLTPAQEDLQYQALVQQVVSMQQDMTTLTLKIQTLQEMLTLLQQNEHAKADLDAATKKAK